MWKNDSVVGDCNCDQFSQVKVCTERDADCAVSLRISCRPCLQPIEKKKDRQPSISRSVQHAVMMLLDVAYQQHWWIPTRLEKHKVTSKEWRSCKHASTNRHTCCLDVATRYWTTGRITEHDRQTDRHIDKQTDVFGLKRVSLIHAPWPRKTCHGVIECRLFDAPLNAGQWEPVYMRRNQLR